MSIHKELSFEQEICEHLDAHGWEYAEGDSKLFDRERTLFIPDLVAWMERGIAPTGDDFTGDLGRLGR